MLDDEKDPVIRMNWLSTWALENEEPFNPLALYILRCRQSKMYPADMGMRPIRDFSDDYEC